MNVATVLSLLLLCAVTVLWVRSYWVAEVVVHWSPGGVPISHRLFSGSGYLGLVRVEPPAGSSVQVPKRGWFYGHGPAGANDASRFASRFPDSRDSFRLLGVAYFDVTYTRTVSTFVCVIRLGGVANVDILNCTWPHRDAQCPRHFCTALRPTDEPNVAICESCLERVYLCRTSEEADARMRRGERVAKGYLVPGEVIVGPTITKAIPDEATAE